MPAFVLAEVQEILNEADYLRYRPLGADAVAKRQGSYLVRGGAAHRLEGDWSPEKLTLLQFPSLELAKAWYDSPEYRAAREVRKDAVRMRFVAIDAPG